jgi:hypothetical protein
VTPIACRATEQVILHDGTSEFYRCSREDGHTGLHHGPLIGHLPVGDEAFLTWPDNASTAGPQPQLYPWQREFLDRAFQRVNGRWAARKLVLLKPRRPR